VVKENVKFNPQPLKGPPLKDPPLKDPQVKEPEGQHKVLLPVKEPEEPPNEGPEAQAPPQQPQIANVRMILARTPQTVAKKEIMN